LSQLRTFVAVARAGGFGAASRELHVSQPTLTTQVRLLEERYAVELFVRDGRGVKLTETGRRLFALTGQLAGIEAEAIQLLRDAGELRRGRLAIGAVSPYQVTDMLAEFARRHPGIAVQARFGNSEFVLRELLAFNVDVGVLAQFATDPRIASIPYSRNSIVALVPRRHRFAARRAIRIDELAGERMVVREEGSTARKVFESALARARVTPQIVMELGSREAIREAVAKGIGIGTVADVSFPPDTRVRTVPFADVDAFTETYLYCLHVRRSAPVVDAFLRTAQALAPAVPAKRSATRRTARGR